MDGLRLQTDAPSAAGEPRAQSPAGLAARLADLLRLARPWHWIKNGFILAPVPFALLDRGQTARFDLFTFLCGLIGFGLVSSAVYVFNDLVDADADRRHPRKCARPIAAGRVSASAAALFALLLAGAGFASAAWVGRPAALGLTGLYAGINVLYCLGAKHVPVVDVLMVSSGFLIRVVLGCALVAVAPSPWLLACSSALALFLAFAKRRADLMAGVSLEHRPVLRGYNTGFLSIAMAATGLAAAGAYTLYTLDSTVFLDGRRWAGVPFVVFGVSNYLRLAHRQGVGEAPEEWIMTAWTTQACVAGWAAATAWSAGLW